MDNEFNDISMKTKLIVRSEFMARRFDEKWYFSSVLVFRPHWDYENYNEKISQKNINLSTKHEIHSKYDVIDGSIVSRLRQPIIYSFVLEKPCGYKVSCEPEALQ